MFSVKLSVLNTDVYILFLTGIEVKGHHVRMVLLVGEVDKQTTVLNFFFRLNFGFRCH
jgi:hypothetical protein